MPYTFPIGYPSGRCYLVPIAAELVPFVAGALRIYEAQEAWHDEIEHERAYNAFAELEACMTRLCLDDLLERHDRLYRLLDTALYGKQYTVADDDPLVIYPAIPAVQPVEAGQLPGLIAQAQEIFRSIDNGINGRIYPNFSSSTAIRNQLATIIELLEAQESANNEDVIAQLQVIAGLLA